MRLKRTAPCKECPFRQESVRGWLGPWTVDTILQQVHSDFNPLPGLACHLDVKVQQKKGLDGQELYAESHVCVGSLHHANASCKRYRHPELSAMADRLGLLDTIMDLFKFRNHHGGR